MFWVTFSTHDLMRTRRFCIHLLAMLSQVALLVFKKGPKYKLPSRIILLNAGILSRMHFRHIVNVGPKRKASECMPLTTGKMNFYVSLTSEYTILLNIHICTNSHPVVQSSHWKRKWRIYTVNISLLLPIKQQITWSLFENHTTWKFWKGNKFYEYICTCSVDEGPNSCASY